MVAEFGGAETTDALFIAQLKEIAEQAQSSAHLQKWPPNLRGSPNVVVRSALFTVRRGARQQCNDIPIFVLGDDVTIFFSGEELRTEDEDVFNELLHRARGQSLHEPIEFSTYNLLHALLWPSNPEYYRRLPTHLERLHKGVLRVDSARRKCWLSLNLVRKLAWKNCPEGRGGIWQVWLEPEIRRLFWHNDFTLVPAADRMRLGPIAKRLMGFFGSHRRPHAMKVDAFRQLCGSKTQAKRKWRQLLQRALSELVEVGYLKKFQIDAGDRVRVTRVDRHALRFETRQVTQPSNLLPLIR